MIDINFEIVTKIGVISEGRDGWNKELNIVSWGGETPKVDIRSWDENYSRMTRGITLTENEMNKVVELWRNREEK